MDTAKLIEEAERWAKNVSESPGRGTAGEDLYGAKLLFNLAAALRETTARAEALSIALTYAETKRGKDFDYDEWARLVASARDGKPALGAHEVEIALHAETRKRAEKAERERDALAAANVAANKRIEALEHESDAARAELARLTTPRPIAEAPKDERSRILARGRDGQWREMRLVRGEWRWFGAGNEHIESPTEYLPLPVLP